MKRLVLTAALLGVLILPLAAQTPQAKGKRAGKIGDHATQGMQRLNRRMGGELGLSEDQKSKIKAIQKETREKMAPMMKEEMQKITAILTPEQKKKLAELMKQRRGAMAGAQGGMMKSRRPGAPGANL